MISYYTFVISYYTYSIWSIFFYCCCCCCFLSLMSIKSIFVSDNTEAAMLVQSICFLLLLLLSYQIAGCVTADRKTRNSSNRIIYLHGKIHLIRIFLSVFSRLSRIFFSAIHFIMAFLFIFLLNIPFISIRIDRPCVRECYVPRWTSRHERRQKKKTFFSYFCCCRLFVCHYHRNQ